MDKQARIFVAGGQTLLGDALIRRLTEDDFTGLVGVGANEPDLTDRDAVERFFAAAQPEYVFLPAGKSGGIKANQRYPVDLMLDNLLIECAVIPAAYRHGVKKLLYLASSCSYPKFAEQPIAESALLTGALEPTNEAYAVAKIAGIKLCQAYRQQYAAPFITAIPANMFGVHDDVDPEDAHVIGALMSRMHAAKERQAPEIEIWGSGAPLREFIYADDVADACLLLMDVYDDAAPINIAGGTELSIRALAERIQEVTAYPGTLRFDPTQPDGMPRKSLDASRLLALGWQPRTPFSEALQRTYDWFCDEVAGADEIDEEN